MNNEEAIEYIILVLTCIGVLFCLGACTCLAPICQCCSYTYWEARKSFRKFWVVKALLLFFGALWIATNILELQIILWGDKNCNYDQKYYNNSSIYGNQQELSSISDDGLNYYDDSNTPINCNQNSSQQFEYNQQNFSDKSTEFNNSNNQNNSFSDDINCTNSEINSNYYTNNNSNNSNHQNNNNNNTNNNNNYHDNAIFNVDFKTLQLMCRLYLFIGTGVSLPMFLWLSYLALKACSRQGMGNYERWLWGENGSIILRALLYSSPFIAISFFGAWLETDLDSKTYIFSRDEEDEEYNSDNYGDQEQNQCLSCSDWSNSVLIAVGLVIFVLLMIVYFGKATLSISKMVINYDYRRRIWFLYISIGISLIIYAAAVIAQFSVVEIDWVRNLMRLLRVIAQLITIYSVSVAMVIMPSISSCQADQRYQLQDTEMRLLLYQQVAQNQTQIQQINRPQNCVESSV